MFLKSHNATVTFDGNPIPSLYSIKFDVDYKNPVSAPSVIECVFRLDKYPLAALKESGTKIEIKLRDHDGNDKIVITFKKAVLVSESIGFMLLDDTNEELYLKAIFEAGYPEIDNK